MNIPVFGYSAKVSSSSQGPSQFFPLTRDLLNPFIYNIPATVTEQYTECLKQLELSTPINLCETFKIIKRIVAASSDKTTDKSKVENFFVFYILSSGLIDDLAELLTLLDSSWDHLPVQVHVINLSGPNLNTEDLDTMRFQE